MDRSYLVVVAALAACLPQHDTRPARRPARPLDVEVDHDELLELPLPSTLAPAGMAPGGHTDGHGVAYGGTTGLDTRYALDGADTTDPFHGGAGTLLPRELIGRLAVTGAGTVAQGIGGVVSIETPAGADALHGSVFGAISPARLAASPRTPAQRDTIAVIPRAGGDTSFGATLGGPIVEHRLWFFAGIAPQQTRIDYTRTVRSQTDLDSDGVADVDPLTREPILATVSSEVRTENAYTVPAVGRLDLQLPRDRAMLSAVVSPWRQEHPQLVGALTAGSVTTGLASDVSARWDHRLLGDRARIGAAIGWHRTSASDGALDESMQDKPQVELVAASLGDVGTLGGESPETIARCTDGTSSDRFLLIPNCPLPSGYATGGPGLLVDEMADRRSAVVSATLDGISVGLGARDERVSYDDRYSGGKLVIHDVHAMNIDEQLFLGMLASPGETDPAYDHVCVGGGEMHRCRLDGLHNDAESLAWSAYIQDRWRPRQGLELRGALRYDAQRLYYPDDLRGKRDPGTGAPLGTTALALDGVSGTAGVTYDPTQEGRARLFAELGRHTEPLALDVVTQHFGRGVLVTEIFDSQASSARAHIDVAPSLRAGYVDEAFAGGDVELAHDLWLGVAGVHREVGRAVEDVGVPGGAYLITNPENATRTYDALALTASHRLSGGLYLQASYTYARTSGSYSGIVDDDGSMNAHTSPQLDSAERRTNATGPLPQDRPHILKADAFYELPLGAGRVLVLGSRVRVVSGTPRTAIDQFGGNFLLPRGALGRTPTVETLDLHLAVRAPLSRRFAAELYADLFNLFNDEAVYTVDDIYTQASLTSTPPISGGTAEDLVWLKERNTNIPARRNPHTGEPRAFYGGRYVTLGARLQF